MQNADRMDRPKAARRGRVHDSGEKNACMREQKECRATVPGMVDLTDKPGGVMQKQERSIATGAGSESGRGWFTLIWEFRAEGTEEGRARARQRRRRMVLHSDRSAATDAAEQAPAPSRIVPMRALVLTES